MARTREPKAKVETVYVGLWWPCSANPIKHPDLPTVVPIERKNKHFIACSCGTTTFFSKDWKSTIGMTAKQAKEAGFHVPQVIIL